MEILFVSHKYPPATGGMEKQSYELIQGMHEFATVRKIVYTGEESYLQFFRKLNKRINSMLQQYPGIRLIHFNDGLMAAACLWHKGYSHLRRVVTVHGLDVVFPLAIYQRFILPRFNRYDQIIAVSQATAKEAVYRGIDQNKIFVIPNGIDHKLQFGIDLEVAHAFRKKYNLQKDDKILVLLGRPVKRKGFSWFIREVLPKLPKEYKVLMAGPFSPEPTKVEKNLSWFPSSWQNLYQLFMGFPSDQVALRTLLNDKCYEGRVQHLGKLPQPELEVFLNCSDAFIMPNIHVPGDMEGFGLVCLEASVCGALVIASAIDGITDAIQDQKNGFHIKSEDVECWVSGIKEVLDDNEVVHQKREAFRQFTLANFSWSKMVQAYAKKFEELLSNS